MDVRGSAKKVLTSGTTVGRGGCSLGSACSCHIHVPNLSQSIYCWHAQQRQGRGGREGGRLSALMAARQAGCMAQTSKEE
jgi:hypothetical protein